MDKIKNIAQSIINLILPIAKNIYGDKPHNEIIKRINLEAYSFSELGINDLDLLFICIKVSKLTKEGNIIISRTSMSNSLIYYLLGISNVNPLPRHTYCPKCHTFYWGNKESNRCSNCGEILSTDGYNLPFELLLDDIKRIGFKFNYSSNTNITIRKDKYEIKLFDNKLITKLAFNLNLSQKETKITDLDQQEIINCLYKAYYSKHYKKEHILTHQGFIGLEDLGSEILLDYLKEYPINNFDELVKLICLLHGTKVHDSYKRNLIDTKNLDINNCISSRDDLFRFLKLNQFNDEDAAIICRETRINCDGHLSPLSETKLKQAGVEQKYIDFIKGIRYIFHKGHVIGHTRLEFIIAKIYLENPIRYYKAYFLLHKDLITKINENDDFIKCLVETRNYDLEKIYLGIIDLRERGFNPIKLIREIKQM